MSKETYNDRSIVRYLLNSLPEAEAERFDELSIADVEFAEALSAAEKDLVDAYIQGELSGAELENFRSYYLASPLRRDKVEFALAFQTWAEKNAVAQAPEEREEQARKPQDSKAFGLLRALQAPRLSWQWGLASAALVLLLVGGWLVFERARVRQQEEQRLAKIKSEQERDRAREEVGRLKQQPAPESRVAENVNTSAQTRPSPPKATSVAFFVLKPQMRGIGQVSTVSIPASTGYVAMQLELESNDYPAYRVALVDSSNNQVLWRSGKINATTNGKALSVRLRPGLLKPQTYLLQVSGVPANGRSEVVGDYPFRVVR